MAMATTSPSWVTDGSAIADPLGHGERAVTFLRNLRHPKSRKRGQAFSLDPWVERIVRRIYGPRHEVDDPANFVFRGDRIVKSCFIMVPRGARKTSLGAALTLLHLIGPEKREYGQIVCAASDKKQAGIAYSEAVSIIRNDRRLNGLTKITDHTKLIRNLKTGTKLEAISADGGTQHGRTPAFVLADELHAWKDHSGLWEALKTGLAKEDNSLLVITTTAGRGQSGAAWDQYS
jgi:phage terminase large subunit-like protein